MSSDVDAIPSPRRHRVRSQIPRRAEQLLGLEAPKGGSNVRCDHRVARAHLVGQAGDHGLERRRALQRTPYACCAAVQDVGPCRHRVIEDQRIVEGDGPHVRSGHHRIFTWQGVPHGSTSWQHGRVHLPNGRKQPRGGEVHDLETKSHRWLRGRHRRGLGRTRDHQPRCRRRCVEVPLSPVALAGGNGFFSTGDAVADWRFSSDGGNNWGTPAAPPTFAPALLGGEANQGITMSAAGLYMFTTDGGNNWSSPTTPPAFTATAMSEDGAVVAGASAAWAYTLDGGDTWLTPTTPPTITAQLLTGTGLNAIAMDAAGTYTRTADGGVTWLAPTIPPSITATAIAGGGLSVVAVAGTSYEFSSNGGQTLRPRDGRALPFFAALVAGSMLNYVTTSGSSWAFSVDAGNNWTLASGPVPSFVPNYLAGCGGTSFVATDNGGNWAFSTDGGNTWASPAAEPTILQ